MGYRLNAKIPNVTGYNKEIELGKQYYGWEEFNAKWFGSECQTINIISWEIIEELYEDLIENNNEILNDEYNTILNGEYNTKKYVLYNLDKLEEMVDYAAKNRLDVLFVSY